jgi:hypothetical protein
MKRLTAAIMLVLASLAVHPAALPAATGQAPARWPMPAAATPLAFDEASAPAQPSSPQVISGPLYAKTYGGYEFRPSVSDLGYGSANNALYATTLVSGKSFRLPINLPNGAQVITVTFFYLDNDPVATVNGITMGVISYTAESAIATSITNTTTSSMTVSATVQSLSFAGNPLFTVDNASTGYRLSFSPTVSGTVQLPALQQIVGVRVNFALPTSFLPVVQK